MSEYAQGELAIAKESNHLSEKNFWIFGTR